MFRRARTFNDCCADCGASDPSWASINRGILLCVECCSVHRSMGRHISHVKSLHQGTWPPTLLSMVNAMTVQNVNSIWEHLLLDPMVTKHTRRKPQPKDSLQVKSEFIKAKHQKLAFMFKPRKDDVPCTQTELSRQLHSSVRSANLDTSLRLLVQGADPNYFNQEKGTACLHVACRTGNSSQAELLIAWGADPNVKDSSGNTPSASAKVGGHNELADRMLELVYEVTDRLGYHFCNKKPNHKEGHHYLSLDKKSSHEMTEVAKAARGKLQLLPNHLFEELVMDVYDEVDRRECEAVWVTSAIGLERFGVAFLPVNPLLSAPRNQGRQKLARLLPGEMAALIKDILIDASRRQHIATLNPSSLAPSISKGNIRPSLLKQIPHVSDDEPLYDSVASDEDYAALLPVTPNEIKENKSPKIGDRVSKTYDPALPPDRSSVTSPQHLPNASSNDLNKEIEILKEQLLLKDVTIADLQSKLEILQINFESLKSENTLLKKTAAESRNSVLSSSSPPTRDLSNLSTNDNDKDLEKESPNEYSNDLFDYKPLNRSNQRPTSMYETRERSKYNFQLTKHQFTSTDNNEVLCENPCNAVTINNVPNVMPVATEIHKHTEVITKGIQELWAAMQDPIGQGRLYGSKASKIKLAVEQLISIFPKKSNDKISSALCQLSSSCKNLETVCDLWNDENKASEGEAEMDTIRTAAYELAKAAKILVSNFPLDSDNA